jgi:GrpB-like predicted nucleotidyltransferase (UPF0157 family)
MPKHAGASGHPAEEPVRPVDYDPTWPERFELERRALVAAIGGFVVDGVHHVGSTAVPGLAAKPIIYILVGVESLEASRPCGSLVTPLGYQYFPYRAEEMHWFCKPDPGHRTHHLHLVPARSERFSGELAFRDYLRSHPEVSAAYTRLKRGPAARFSEDREEYTRAKAPFVEQVLRLALGEV